MKRYFALVLAPALLLPALQAKAQGFPVMDVANIAQTIEAVNQLRQQLNAQIQLLQSLQGTRAVSQLLLPSLDDSALPGDWGAVYGAYLSRAGRSVPVAPNSPCSDADPSARALCTLSSDQQRYEVSWPGTLDAGTKRRSQTVGALAAALAQSGDTKSSVDLTARLIAESAAIQNDQVRILGSQVVLRQLDRSIEEAQRSLARTHLQATAAGSDGLPLARFP